jgi:hypothetical protein
MKERPDNTTTERKDKRKKTLPEKVGCAKTSANSLSPHLIGHKGLGATIDTNADSRTFLCFDVGK